MPGFAAVYAQKRGVVNAELLEKAVLDAQVKPTLESMMRQVHAERKPLKVALLGGGPCLETAVIMQLVEELKLIPELEVEFVNYEKVSDWQAGHSALTVPVSTVLGDIVENASDRKLTFWRELGQQHIVIAW